MEFQVQLKKTKKKAKNKKVDVKPEYKLTYFDDFIVFLADFIKFKNGVRCEDEKKDD